MAKVSHHPTIELNGQRYNAHTGTLIDGVRRVAATQRSEVKPVSKRSATTSRQVHKSTQPSHTLMRRAVKRPSTITTHTTVAMDVVSNTPGQALSQVFHTPKHERSARAHSVHKLSQVSRFGSPAAATSHHSQKPQMSDMISARTTPLEAPQPIMPAAQVPTSTANKMIEKGLRAADSHAQHATKNPHLRHRVGKRLGISARITSIAAGSLAVLLLVGFFAYQNIPNINVRYAAAKAGVSGSLPDYQPAGFAVNSHIEYSPGSITIAYKANADNRNYTLTQANTNWNSQALRDHLATTTGAVPQTYPQNGQTIYLHDGTRADWVNNGVWYSIRGDSSLNTDQLIKIAGSI